jgi:hypothetical protein
MAKQNTIHRGSTVCQSKETLSNSVDAETVLLNISKSSYYGMGPVASHIWNALAQPIRVTDLIENLLQEFDVERETCERDVINFLQQLSSEDLIDVRNP